MTHLETALRFAARAEALLEEAHNEAVLARQGAKSLSAYKAKARRISNRIEKARQCLRQLE